MHVSLAAATWLAIVWTLVAAGGLRARPVAAPGASGEAARPLTARLRARAHAVACSPRARPAVGAWALVRTSGSTAAIRSSR